MSIANQNVGTKLNSDILIILPNRKYNEQMNKKLYCQFAKKESLGGGGGGGERGNSRKPINSIKYGCRHGNESK